MGNFPETVKRIQPVSQSHGVFWIGFEFWRQMYWFRFLRHSQQLNSIIAASMSIKSSAKLKKILEVSKKREYNTLM